MNDLIERLVNGIIRQEGMPQDYPNPGNLRAAPWAIRSVLLDGFWHPSSREEGIAGAAHLVALGVARGNTLSELIAHWAPPSENKTAVYIANMKKWAGIPDENQPLWSYLT